MHQKTVKGFGHLSLILAGYPQNINIFWFPSKNMLCYLISNSIVVPTLASCCDKIFDNFWLAKKIWLANLPTWKFLPAWKTKSSAPPLLQIITSRLTRPKTLLYTRPWPAFSRQGLVGSSGGYTSHASPRVCGARLSQNVQELVEYAVLKPDSRRNTGWGYWMWK